MIRVRTLRIPFIQAFGGACLFGVFCCVHSLAVCRWLWRPWEVRAEGYHNENEPAGDCNHVTIQPQCNGPFLPPTGTQCSMLQQT